MKGRIYLKDWLKLKPYHTQTVTDGYYLKLCNEIKEKLISNHSEILFEYFDAEFINILPCFIASYFEDVISETNIWATFVRLHKEFYNKPLPFYDTGEYYEDEINEQDVRFLLWYFFNTVQTSKFINPNSRFFAGMANDIMEILDEKYEYAPENKVLKMYYEINPLETDFHHAVNLIDSIIFNTYLFYTDTLLDLHYDMNDIAENASVDQEDIFFIMEEYIDTQLHKVYTRLLSLKGKEWAAKIIGERHPLSKDFRNMSDKVRGLFLYKGQNSKFIFVEHVASGKKFNLTKKSFRHYNKLKKTDTILYLGIVKWKGEWWLSGIYLQSDYMPDLISDEKNSTDSLMSANFLDYNSKKVRKTLKLQFKIFQKFTNGSQIVFMPSDKIDDFVKKYIEYYNLSLNLKSDKRAIQDDLENTGTKESEDLTKISETGLVFFNPNSGIEVALGINSAFPLPENKYFNEDESTEHVKQLLYGEDFSKELVMFCINNCKNDLPFFEEEGKKLLEDIDFLLRFWKKDNYHTVPSITIK